MTSRETVYHSLDFSLKGRIPRHLWLLSWAERRFPKELKYIQSTFPDDIVHSPAPYRTPLIKSGDPYEPGRYTDEWGCTFENIHQGVHGEIRLPLIESLNEIDKLRLPEELLSLDKEAVNVFCRQSDKFVLQATCARPFERLQFLRKSDNLYIDLAEESDEFYELLRKVHEMYLKEMQVWADTEIDALFFMDDWGSQRSLLISPAQWKRIFKPLYKDYIDIAHSSGKRIFMHSDGYILDIIPELIDLGLDALNSQIFCMGLDRLANFKGKLCFWGEIDRQFLLSRGTKSEIQAAVESVKENLCRDGGVIAQCEFGPGHNPENIYTVFETWDKLPIE